MQGMRNKFDLRKKYICELASYLLNQDISSEEDIPVELFDFLMSLKSYSSFIAPLVLRDSSAKLMSSERLATKYGIVASHIRAILNDSKN